MPQKLTAPLFAVIVVLLAYCGNLAGYRHLHPAGDPDRFFHYAIDRQTVQTGLVHELPQVEDLGWGSYFPDKAFLFHAVTSVGFAIGGETGANRVNYAFGAATFLLLLFFSARRIGWLRATLLVLALGLANPYFSPRMTFFRAHVPAIFFLTVFLIGLSLRRPGVVALSAAFYALTYHAFYIPIAILGLAGVATRFRDRRILLFGLGGLVFGYLATPYFPGNLVAAIEQLKIALFYSRIEAGVTPGGEILPLSFANFAIAFGPDLLLLGAAGYVAWRTRRVDALFPILTSALFWCLSVRTPRACEYAIPATIIAFAWSLHGAAAYRRSALALLAVATALPLLYYGSLLRGGRPDLEHLAYNESIFEALAAIPRADHSEKLLTCDWTFGSYALYARPDLRFVDALDPRSLQFRNEEKFSILRDLKLGKIMDVGAVVTAFHARYLLCDEPTLNRIVDHDARFQRIYAAPVRDLGGEAFRSSVMLFRLKD